MMMFILKQKLIHDFQKLSSYCTNADTDDSDNEVSASVSNTYSKRERDTLSQVTITLNTLIMNLV